MWHGDEQPAARPRTIAVFAVIVAFSSASQDIVIDAYRIEMASERLQAALAAAYMTGYRLAMILAGAGALAFAAWFGSDNGYDVNGWKHAYFIMAAFMLVGLITALCIHEPSIDSAEIDNIERNYRRQLTENGMDPKLQESLHGSIPPR